MKLIKRDNDGTILNELVYKFITLLNNVKAPILGPIIKAKASIIAEELGFEDFKASNGWFDKFKVRFHLNHYLCGWDKGLLSRPRRVPLRMGQRAFVPYKEGPSVDGTPLRTGQSMAGPEVSRPRKFYCTVEYMLNSQEN
uniref:HTH CENPB-type domain-containing protein n=1 Tax=Strigamia maritima TaxID=126957 RepID=T1IJK6_STRMM